LDELETIGKEQKKTQEKLKKESYARFVEECGEAMKRFGQEED